MFDVEAALRELVAEEGSDLHLKVGSRAAVPRPRRARPRQRRRTTLSAEDTEQALMTLLSRTRPSSEEFAHEHEVDFSFEIAGVARFRVNAFRQRGLVSLVCRAIPHEIRTIDELALPPVVRELAEEERGIILLTGTTGSGKSTTLAAMIDHMNHTMSKHIVTIEDPIEFVHTDKRSAINQREVGMDTASFRRALRRVLRQDPDVILVGEMRDEETVQTRALGGRDRPPRALDDPHRRRHRVDQPHARLLPAAPAQPGAQHDRRHAQGRHLPAARARPPTAGASRSARSCA